MRITFSIANEAMVQYIAGIMKSILPGGKYRAWTLQTGVRMNCALPPGNPFLKNSSLN